LGVVEQLATAGTFEATTVVAGCNHTAEKVAGACSFVVTEEVVVEVAEACSFVVTEVVVVEVAEACSFVVTEVVVVEVDTLEHSLVKSGSEEDHQRQGHQANLKNLVALNHDFGFELVASLLLHRKVGIPLACLLSRMII